MSDTLPLSIGEGIGIYNLTERVRIPVIFKTLAKSSSGTTALWTPTSGKKFRLQKYNFYVSGDARYNADTAVFIQFRDQSTSLPQFRHELFVPGVALNKFGGYISKWIDLGNGYLSSTINNSLMLELGLPLTTGFIRVNVCGTEE